MASWRSSVALELGLHDLYGGREEGNVTSSENSKSRELVVGASRTSVETGKWFIPTGAKKDERGAVRRKAG